MKLITASILCSALFVGACSSVQYKDPSAPETLTIDFGSTDLQTLAGHMVESLNTSPSLNYINKTGTGDDKRIVLYIDNVNNKTSEHIDTGGITDAMKKPLLGKFRIVAAKQGQESIGDQVRFQQGEGRVDPAQAKAFGHQVGADVVLYGNLRSIEKSRGRTLESGGMKREDVWYQFNLEAVNIETGEVIWAEQKEIRKYEKTGIFGG